MENYIVRIYRRDHRDPDKVIGTLESVEQQTQQTFQSLNALRSLLVSNTAAEKPQAETSQAAAKLDGPSIALVK